MMSRLSPFLVLLCLMAALTLTACGSDGEEAATDDTTADQTEGETSDDGGEAAANDDAEEPEDLTADLAQGLADAVDRSEDAPPMPDTPASEIEPGAPPSTPEEIAWVEHFESITTRFQAVTDELGQVQADPSQPPSTFAPRMIAAADDLDEVLADYDEVTPPARYEDAATAVENLLTKVAEEQRAFAVAMQGDDMAAIQQVMMRGPEQIMPLVATMEAEMTEAGLTEALDKFRSQAAPPAPSP